jgi:surface polysaccharide O-acyltransferase-like enzyme
MKRNLSVELSRIVGCIIVLACHADFYHTMGASAPTLYSLNLSLFSDGVVVFWFICGFFFFQGDNWKRKWKHAVKRILLPMIAALLFSFFFAPILFESSNLRETFLQTSYIKTYWQNVFLLRTPDSHTEHLWYLFAYLLLLVIFPLLKKVADWLHDGTYRKVLFLLISFAAFVGNDISGNTLFSFGFYFWHALLPVALLVLFGHVLYPYLQKLSGRFFLFASIPLWIGLNSIRMYFNNHLGVASAFTLNVWYSSFGILSACLLLYFCFSVGKYVHLQERPILFLSGHSMGIYLIHPFVMDYFQTLGLWKSLETGLQKYLPAAPAVAVFTILCVAATFLCSLLISVLCSYLGKCFFSKDKQPVK